MDTNEQKAAHIAYLASQLELRSFNDPIEEQKFTMYSYDRIARLLIQGMIEEMLDRGFTEDQVKDVLMSTQVRHTLDDYEDELISEGRKLANDFQKMD